MANPTNEPRSGNLMRRVANTAMTMMDSDSGRLPKPQYLPALPHRSDFECSMHIERPPSLDSESQMRIYEELEREASLRQEKIKTQYELVCRHTEAMKNDLGSGDAHKSLR